MKLLPRPLVKRMNRASTLALLVLCLGCGGGGGSAPPPPPPQPSLPAASGNFTFFVQNELLPSIRNVTGSGASADPADQRNEFILPTAAQLATWRTVFQRIRAGDYLGAHTLAGTISTTYNVVRYTDTATSRTLYVLMEGVPGAIPAAASHATSTSITTASDPTRRGWGTYVFSAAPLRLISLHAPHPKDDLETADQAVETFMDTGAHSLFIAGADRDQNVALAACDQSSRPYLEADACHNGETLFQIAFEETYGGDPTLWHLQFHGNATCAEDVFLSNAVLNPPAMLTSLANNIAAASTAAAGGGAVLTVDVYDNAGDCSLRATQNTQMRYAAGIPHAQVCANGLSPATTSRFVHIEQLRIARRAANDPLASPGRNRAVISGAIRQTFP
jgi:hypothetical protein